jgi:hypothetical protein
VSIAMGGRWIFQRFRPATTLTRQGVHLRRRDVADRDTVGAQAGAGKMQLEDGLTACNSPPEPPSI